MTDRAAPSTSSSKASSKGGSTPATRKSSVRPRQLTEAEAAVLPPKDVLRIGGNFYLSPNASVKRRRSNDPNPVRKNVSSPSPNPPMPRPKPVLIQKGAVPPALLGIGLDFDEDAPDIDIKQEPDLPFSTPVLPQFLPTSSSRPRGVLQNQNNVSPDVRIKQEEPETESANSEVRAEVPLLPVESAVSTSPTSASTPYASTSNHSVPIIDVLSSETPAPETLAGRMTEVTPPEEENLRVEAISFADQVAKDIDLDNSHMQTSETPIAREEISAMTAGAEVQYAEMPDVEMSGAVPAKAKDAVEEEPLVETVETFREVTVEAAEYFDCDLEDISYLQGRVETIISMCAEPDSGERHYLVQMVGASNLIVVPEAFFSWTEEHKDSLKKFTSRNTNLKTTSLSDYEKENNQPWRYAHLLAGEIRY